MSRTKWLGLGIKLLLTIGLFWLILHKCDWTLIKQRLGAMSVVAAGGMCLLICIQTLILTLRWRWITECMGYTLSLRDGLMGQLISQFFNQGLPSSIGGDGVRIWWLTRIRVPLRQALENVLFDRLAGFFSLLLLVAASLCLLVSMTQDQAPIWGLAMITVASLAGALVVFLPWRFGWGRFLQQSNHFVVRLAGKGINWALDFRRLVLAVIRSPRDILRIGGSSLGVHLLSVMLGFFIARELGVAVTFWQCLAAMFPALLVAYLPLSIAGWGVREGAMVLAFGLIGVPASDAVVVSVTLGLGYLVVALCGGIVWVVGGVQRFHVNAT
jgi:uncharacterized protein (TIRG00374 family)